MQEAGPLVAERIKGWWRAVWSFQDQLRIGNSLLSRYLYVYIFDFIGEELEFELKN